MSQPKMMRAAQANPAHSDLSSRKQLALSRGATYLEYARRAQADGDNAKALSLTNEGIRLTNSFNGYLAVGDALRELQAAFQQTA